MAEDNRTQFHTKRPHNFVREMLSSSTIALFLRNATDSVAEDEDREGATGTVLAQSLRRYAFKGVAESLKEERAT